MQDLPENTIALAVHVRNASGTKRLECVCLLEDHIREDDFAGDHFLMAVIKPMFVAIHEALYIQKFGRLPVETSTGCDNPHS